MTHGSAGGGATLATAVIDGTLVVVDAARDLVEAELDLFCGELSLGTGGPTMPTCPVLVEVWNVREGRSRPFGVDERAWHELAALAGGAALALPAVALASALGSPTGAAAAANRMTDLVRRTLASQAAWAGRTFGTYHELSVSVPDVRCGSSAEPSLYVAGMFTDSPFARVVDRAMRFGFRKRPAGFVTAPDDIRVRSSTGATLAELRLDPARGVPAPDTAHGDSLRRWLRQPLLGVSSDSRLVRSAFERTALGDLEASSAELRVAEGFPLLGVGVRVGQRWPALAYRQPFAVALGAPVVVGEVFARKEPLHP